MVICDNMKNIFLLADPANIVIDLILINIIPNIYIYRIARAGNDMSVHWLWLEVRAQAKCETESLTKGSVINLMTHHRAYLTFLQFNQ